MRASRAKIIASLSALTVIVGTGSYGTFAAFTETTTNSGNAFSAGTLDISNGGSTSAAFSLANLRPGDLAVTRCFRIVNTGSLDFNSLRFYGTVTGTGNSGNGLAPFLAVTVERGSATLATGGASFSCTGFDASPTTIFTGLLSGFPTSASPVVETGTPATGWTAGAAKGYRVTVQLPSDVVSASAEAATAALTLNWDASS